MKILVLLVTALSFGFGQILEIDSIVHPGNWIDPENIFVSDDLYGCPEGNQDNLILSIADPVDTLNALLDSVKVYLEQYVSDTTKGFWYVIPIINGTPGTANLQQAGSLIDSLLCFDISTDVTTWADLIGLSIDLHPKKGTGAPPEWFADYLYVFTYTTTGIFEEGSALQEYSVLEIYPNPFTKLTNISFGKVQGAKSIELKIYSITGRLVKDLSYTMPNALSPTHVKWDGTDSFNMKLGSGVYFLDFKAGDYTETRKLLLVK